MKPASASIILLAVLCLAPWQMGAATTQAGLGQKIATYCKDHKGEKVGSGQCAALAFHAIKESGGKRRSKDNPNDGDYVWGDLVLLVEGDPKAAKFSNGKTADLKPGDILQFRDTAFSSREGKKTKSYHFGHHTAVLASSQGATLQIWHQNFKSEQIVTPLSLRMSDLKEGWVRIYRPVPGGEDKSKDDEPKGSKDSSSSED